MELHLYPARNPGPEGLPGVTARDPSTDTQNHTAPGGALWTRGEQGRKNKNLRSVWAGGGGGDFSRAPENG